MGDADVQIGEVAAPAAGDADLLGELGGVVDDQHAASALTGFGGAHHAGGAGADHDDVEVGCEVWVGRERSMGRRKGRNGWEDSPQLVLPQTRA